LINTIAHFFIQSIIKLYSFFQLNSLLTSHRFRASVEMSCISPGRIDTKETGFFILFKGCDAVFW